MPSFYSITPAQIRSAVASLAEHERWRAERLRVAGNLLIRGGWRMDGTRIAFPDGATVAAGRCSCREAPAIECLHVIAARELLPLAERIADAAAWLPPGRAWSCQLARRAPALTLWRWRAV